MSTSLSELVDNMSGNFNSIKCKSCTENNRCDACLKIMQGLIEKVPGIYQVCKDNLNKFSLFIPVNIWYSLEKFDKNTLPPKEAFYSNLNLEDISDEDYTHAQKVWDVFEIKKLGEYTIYMFKVIHYYFQMYMKTLEICVLIYMNLILHILYLHLD